MSKSKFKCNITEEKQIIKATEHYSAEINGYDVILTCSKHDSAELSIYPINSTAFPKVGLIKLRPQNVGEIEALADVAAELLRGIAAELREMGKDDLRTEYERQMEFWRKAQEEEIAQMLAKRKK